jgi:hypothetical protein
MLMPDGRVYMLGYAKPDIEGAMKRLQWGSVKKAVELVIHPATMVQEDLFGSLTNSRVLEYETFRNPGFVKRLSQANIEPVGFEVLYNNSHASH